MGKTGQNGHVQPLSRPAHTLSPDEILRELKVNSEEGLTAAEAKKRLELYGPNELEGGEGVSLAKIVIRQIANAMMLVSCFTLFFKPSPASF
jgi:Na+-exporting ATPase